MNRRVVSSLLLSLALTVSLVATPLLAAPPQSRTQPPDTFIGKIIKIVKKVARPNDDTPTPPKPAPCPPTETCP